MSDSGLSSTDAVMRQSSELPTEEELEEGIRAVRAAVAAAEHEEALLHTSEPMQAAHESSGTRSGYLGRRDTKTDCVLLALHSDSMASKGFTPETDMPKLVICSVNAQASSLVWPGKTQLLVWMGTTGMGLTGRCLRTPGSA